MGGVGGGGERLITGGAAQARNTGATRQQANVLMAVAQDEHVVDVVVAAYSPPAHAVQVSGVASAYL